MLIGMASNCSYYTCILAITFNILSIKFSSTNLAPMNLKTQLINIIIGTLEKALQIAANAAKTAHLDAIDDQSVAETQYDTLGIEASYLAHGQSERVALIKSQIIEYQQLDVKNFTESCPICLGALIRLEPHNNSSMQSQFKKLKIPDWYFLGPNSGGLLVNYNQQQIRVITPESPLALQLLGKSVGDDICLPGHQHEQAEIVAIA